MGQYDVFLVFYERFELRYLGFIGFKTCLKLNDIWIFCYLWIIIIVYLLNKIFIEKKVFFF